MVADFSRILAGPYATMMLGDLGADVIKVESPAGDDTREWVPPRRGDVGTYYLGVNRNKRSIALDLADEHDRAVAHELAQRADVFIQNFRPGGLARFGLDYESVRAGGTRPSSTARSAGSARARARNCPATTCWSRVSPA